MNMILCMISFYVFSYLPFIGMTADVANYPSPRGNTNITKEARVMENDVCIKRYHSYPYLVKLFRITSRGYLQKSCGGTLLDGIHILTAGHCCEYPDQVAHTKIKEGQIESRSIVRMNKHKDYIFRKFYRDVCVMTLESTIYSGYNPYKSRFPTKPLETSELEKMCGRSAVTMVWRYLVMDQPVLIFLQCTNEKIFPFQECAPHANRTTTLPIHNDNVCTLQEELVVVEAGGPLICDNLQVGIGSWTLESADKDAKVYTRVDQNLDFIWSYEMDTKLIKNSQGYRLKLDWWPYLFIINLIFRILPNTFVG